jgi:hypothetical protein
MANPTIIILGAGGKMGLRVGDRLRAHGGYEVLGVETSAAGAQRLAERGARALPAAEALPRADVLILAIPDRAIRTVAPAVIPALKAGALVVSLDPAAAYAGVIPVRPELAYFVTHPCHPPLFHGELSAAAQADYFGGRAARQSVVSALYAGPESAYAVGEQVAAIMFAPILRLHRITVEQMAFLEPGVVESTTLPLLQACKDALDRAVAHGIPEPAARDFVLGHIAVELAIILGFAGFPVSDGAKKAMEIGQEKIFRRDWQEATLSLPAIRDAVRQIVQA